MSAISWIVASRLVGCGYTALGHEIETGIRSTCAVNREMTVVVGLGLRQMLGRSGTRLPQSYGGLRDGLACTEHLPLYVLAQSLASQKQT